MKQWKVFVCLFSLVFLALAGISCQQSGAANSAELRGAIHEDANGGGLYVMSGGKRYHLESQQDLSSMVGKMVTLEGTIAEKEGRYTMTVDSVDE